MFEEAVLDAAPLVARDPRTGAWVSYDPWELPDDVTVCGVLPDGLLDIAGAPADVPAPEPASVAATPLAAVPTGPWLAAALATFETAAAGGYHLVEAA
ncbi:hypothetical protein E1269_06895, partial [Jiangella asiatica]